MEAKAINGVSQLGFEGTHRSHKSHKAQDNASYPQMDAPASRKSSNAMRNAALGLMMATAGLSSCSKDDWMGASASAAAAADVSVQYFRCCQDCGNKKNDTVYIKLPGDTIREVITEYKPVNVKSAPFALMDSLIAQGINVGIPLDGPEPQNTHNHVLFLGSTAYNEYDYKLYETQLDSCGTFGIADKDGKYSTRGQISLITKVTSFYDDYDPSVSVDNPKVSYMRTIVTDQPGVGIKLERSVMSEAQAKKHSQYLDADGKPSYDSPDWNYAGYEIRTNNRNGKTNRSITFDRYDRVVSDGRKGEIVRGDAAGEFLFGKYLYDDQTGEMYIDGDGKPEEAFYDFSQARMRSTEVQAIDENGHIVWDY